jgi:hypothetical protein
VKQYLPAFLLVVGGLLAISGPYLPDTRIPDFFRKVVPYQDPVKILEGNMLFMINEKTKSTADQVISMREAQTFVTEYKMAGYLNIDRDDEFVQPVIKAIKEKSNMEPPLLILAQKLDSGQYKPLKYAQWKDSIKDILK